MMKTKSKISDSYNLDTRISQFGILIILKYVNTYNSLRNNENDITATTN